MTFHKGQRVQTPLGAATIIGFEHFDHGNESKPISDTDTGGRAIVRLDKPENWKPTVLTPNPYMFRSQLGELHE